MFEKQPDPRLRDDFEQLMARADEGKLTREHALGIVAALADLSEYVEAVLDEEAHHE